MTSKEFVIWLRGFTEGVHDFNITPKQWDNLKEELAKVNDYPYSVPVGTGGTGTPNFAVTTTPGNTSITFTTGSNVTYTTNGAPNWYATYFADLNDKTND
jgi:hypothetical protein